MLVGFEEEAVQFRDLVRDVLAKECSVERLRADLKGAQRSRERWSRLAEVGLLAATIPEEFGGLGLDGGIMAPIAEEIGYAALPEPVVETICVVVPLVTQYASAADKERWLPAIAAGEVIATVQLEDMPAAVFGEFADIALVEHGGVLHIAELKANDRVPVPSEDLGTSLAVLRSFGSPLNGSTEPVAEAKARGAASAAAVLNGISLRLLDFSVEYALGREQFGVPIGSFQAVKHMLAEVYAAIESARPSAWAAAKAFASGDQDAALSARVAKLAANRAGDLASQYALQVHGGIGFTWEHHLHIWMKRSKSYETRWGSTRDLRRWLGAVAMDSDDLVETFGPT